MQYVRLHDQKGGGFTAAPIGECVKEPVPGGTRMCQGTCPRWHTKIFHIGGKCDSMRVNKGKQEEFIMTMKEATAIMKNDSYKMAALSIEDRNNILINQKYRK